MAQDPQASVSGDALACELAGRCGGCPWYGRDLASQRAAKVAELRGLAGGTFAGLSESAIAMVTPASHGFRERLDLRLDAGRLGLLGLSEPRGEVIDMARCEVASPALNEALAELRAGLPPTGRASVRLRARSGIRGLWLDLAHVELKALLDERRWLERRLDSGWVVELGPKGRQLARVDGRLALVAPTLAPWSVTRVAGQDHPLMTSVMGFSQPGSAPNAALVEAVLAAAHEGGITSALELGAGAGNLSLPLAGAGIAVKALELDTGALEATLAHARAQHPAIAAIAARVEPVAGSFHREREVPALIASAGVGGRPVDALVCDPPRSGLGRFLGVDGAGGGLAALSPKLRPREVIYVSCHPEALGHDAVRLGALGYHVVSARGIDQFPWTPHAEWVVRFSR